jgi:hypothetical protein
LRSCLPALLHRPSLQYQLSVKYRLAYILHISKTPKFTNYGNSADMKVVCMLIKRVDKLHGKAYKGLTERAQGLYRERPLLYALLIGRHMKKIQWEKVDFSLTRKEICEKYGISLYSLGKYCKKHGITPKPAKRGRKKGGRNSLPKVPLDANLTGSLTALAKQYKVNRATILRQRKVRGVSSDPMQDGRHLSTILTAEQGAKIRAFATSRGLATVQAADIVISAGLEALGFNLLPAKN